VKDKEKMRCWSSEKKNEGIQI